MRVAPILRFGAFVVGFMGIVAFYCLYGKQTLLDSVFFVVLTVTTVGEKINYLQLLSKCVKRSVISRLR